MQDTLSRHESQQNGSVDGIDKTTTVMTTMTKTKMPIAMVDDEGEKRTKTVVRTTLMVLTTTMVTDDNSGDDNDGNG